MSTEEGHPAVPASGTSSEGYVVFVDHLNNREEVVSFRSICELAALCARDSKPHSLDKIFVKSRDQKDEMLICLSFVSAVRNPPAQNPASPL